MTSFMAMMMAGFGIGMASMAVPDKAKSAAAANAVFAMIRRQTKIEVSSGDGPSFDGAVHLQGVDFAYPSRLDRPILKTINLSIEAGKTTALVGPSGSGKSTIVAMLQRFYDPTGGALVLGGCNTDLRNVPLAWWREQIGFVGQEPVRNNGLHYVIYLHFLIIFTSYKIMTSSCRCCSRALSPTTLSTGTLMLVRATSRLLPKKHLPTISS
eukprot:COSAG02_NODE_1220_length_13807_cov_6.303254_4_plen_211_part_00